MLFRKDNSFNERVNSMIEENLPLIIKTISDVTGRYICIENDEEFSVGLLAFTEAIERYDESKGAFPTFAKLVISSRVKNHLLKENKHRNNLSYEELTESGVQIESKLENNVDNKKVLISEINSFKQELEKFNLTLEDLVENSPKHKDTRKNAIGISKKVSKDQSLTSFIFTKRRLPIKQISLKYVVTEKVLKGSKNFILSVIIIFCKNFTNLKLWINH